MTTTTPHTLIEASSGPATTESASILMQACADQATVVSAPASDQQYLVIPLPLVESGDSGNVAGAIPDGLDDPIHPAASLILQLRRQQEKLEYERDGLADQIGQDFEELHWLHEFASDVSACDATAELPEVARRVLPNLKDLIRAEAVLFLPDERQSGRADFGVPPATDGQAIRSGENPICENELIRLAARLDRLSPDRPFVFNRDSGLQRMPFQTSARNIVAVHLMQGQRRYGWLIALNRVPTRNGGEQSRGVLPDDFGSREVGLMSTAAAMLAGHARNNELFRAEESLRVSVIETISAALDARDPNTCGHSRRVGRHAARIADFLGLTREECDRIYITGLLHDVGKIGVPDDILKKTDRLTDEEFEIIKQHPTTGHTILSPLNGLEYVLPGVLHHHERIDGGGYPHGLAGDEIPLDARILAVADSFDAMTSNRTYRNGMDASKAVEILLADGGQQWDTSVVSAFLATRETPTTAEKHEQPRPATEPADR